MLNVMADDAKKKADAIHKHRSEFGKGSGGPAVSMLSQKFMGSKTE